MRPLLLDEESRNVFEMPVQYMFKDIPQAGKQDDYVAYTVAQMDQHNIERAMLGVSDDNLVTRGAIERFPQRFFGSYSADPNRGMEEVRNIVRMKRDYGIKAVTAFPSGLCPQVPIDGTRSTRSAWSSICRSCVASACRGRACRWRRKRSS
jgi:predicted TIM-barrel fold metal-dependent hydrolase